MSIAWHVSSKLVDGAKENAYPNFQRKSISREVEGILRYML
jgi:hypothetical protein